MNLGENYWKTIHKPPFKITKNSKFQWLQYRLINRILATNTFLYKIKKTNTNTCTFCRLEETLEHVFWECANIQSFLDTFETYVQENTNLQLPITKRNFLLGDLDLNKIVHNAIFLWLKYYIYTMRCAEKTLNIEVAISILKKNYEILKHIAYKNGEKTKYDTIWNG